MFSVSMYLSDKHFHIFDIHLSISIVTDESFDFEFISVLLDEVVSGLIGSTSSSINSMIQDDDECFRILSLFLLEHM
jgi:hypothetical protein